MTDKSGKKFSGVFRILVKIGIAAAVIWWLYRRNGADLGTVLADFDYIFLVPVLLISLISTFIASLRWRALAQPLDISLPRRRAFSLTMQGIFFSLVIPGGAIGGDVVKMAALSAHVAAGSRTEGIFSILMDRIVGMISLFLTALILLFFNISLFARLKFADFPEAPAGMFLWWLLLGVCSVGIAAGIGVFCHRLLEKIPGVKPFLDFLDRKSSGKIARIIRAVDTYAGCRGKIIFWVIITGLAIHAVPAVSMAFLLAGAGGAIDFAGIMPAVVIGNIAGLLPLFPGGIGARDAVTIALLITAGYAAEAASAAQLTSTVLLILFNLTGALFFIADRKHPETVK